MALSEEEQKLLDQLEESLRADDPKLAHAMSSRGPRPGRRRVVLAGVGFVVGLAVLIGTLQWHPLLSVVGFLVMLASVVMGIGAWQHSGDVRPSASKPRANRSSGGEAFVERMEERWRKRQEGEL